MEELDVLGELEGAICL